MGLWSVPGTQRRRGVQASRLKLTRALNEAGLATQASLAERIADLEGLDAAPRDMVNRAFREQPVEVRSLDRIANALGVPAHTLYRTADEPEPAAAAPQERAGARRGPVIAAAVALTIALAAVTTAIWLRPPPLPLPSAGPTAPPNPLDLGAGAVLVLPITTPQGADLAAPLRRALDRDFNVARATAPAAVASEDVAELARRLRLDLVIDGEVLEVGRLAAVRLFGFAGGVRQQLWAESLPAIDLPGAVDDIVDRAARAIRHAAGLGDAEAAPGHFPLAPVQDDYLRGRLHLDSPSNELNLKRAETRFEAALRQDPNYARAHAGLCQALLESHWMLEEDRMLLDASRACSQALLLAPEDPVVATAHAHFLRRTGRNDEAIDRYREILNRHPRFAAAFEGLSATQLDAYRQTGDAASLQAAIAAARTAAELDPRLWKPLFSEATMHWFAGDLDQAIAASEAARARDENEYVLANLGTFYICAGAFEQARDAYQRAREVAPASYVGDEFLGMAYYYLGDYDEAARLRERAIESIGEGVPEIHEMWGQLGDAYRHQGNVADAVDAYRRAARIAERDHLRGTAPAANRAARAYYYTILRTLDPTLVPDAIDRDIDAQLDDIEAVQVEATAHRRMAQIWLLRGREDRARAALARAAATCPGYRDWPDLVAIAGPGT